MAEEYPWGERLGYDFFARETPTVARELLGKWLVYHEGDLITAGIVVETEAYLGLTDPAAHSFRGKTARNAVMFGPAGRIYIYFIYGLHYCLNVTTSTPEKPEGVLIRAVEPRLGIDSMAKRRRQTKTTQLCSGPAKLVQAFGIPKELNGSSAIHGPIGFYANPQEEIKDITVTTRVGIKQAADWPLRFYVSGSPYISKK